VGAEVSCVHNSNNDDDDDDDSLSNIVRVSETCRLRLCRHAEKVAHTRLPIERRVPELIPVLGSQSAGDVSHKLGGRLPLLSARPAVTLATLKGAATNFAAW